MIDYDKLKQAHELAHQARPKNGCINVEIIYSVESATLANPYYSINTEDNDGMTDEFCFYTVEELIIKLQELANTKIAQPKYKVGDTVWYIDLPVNQIHSSTILKVRDDEYVINGEINGTKDDFMENELYPTKIALIESQIQHWQSLLEPYCQHKSDNQPYITTETLTLSKCLKCGEFYR